MGHAQGCYDHFSMPHHGLTADFPPSVLEGCLFLLKYHKPQAYLFVNDDIHMQAMGWESFSVIFVVKEQSVSFPWFGMSTGFR